MGLKEVCYKGAGYSVLIPGAVVGIVYIGCPEIQNSSFCRTPQIRGGNRSSS